MTVLEASGEFGGISRTVRIMATEWILAGIGSFPKMTV